MIILKLAVSSKKTKKYLKKYKILTNNAENLIKKLLSTLIKWEI